jgi:hypothetical protein
MSGITLKLAPAPTFRVTVEVPVPGTDKPATFGAEFVYMDASTREAFYAAGMSEQDADGNVTKQGRSDAQTVLEILKSWDIDAGLPVTKENIEALENRYSGFAYQVARKWSAELLKAKLGN